MPCERLSNWHMKSLAANIKALQIEQENTKWKNSYKMALTNFIKFQ
jgi:hypothetical protein